MDYKAKLQTNNTELANNNVDLQAILNTINTLPEAGGGGTDTSDATATSTDILNGKTAYGANGKMTGTFSLDGEITTQEAVIAQIQTALEGKATGGVTPPTYNIWETTINYTVGGDGYIYIRYLAPDNNGFIEWKQTENLTGEGTIIIESLSQAWLLVECRQTNWMSEYSLSIEQVNDMGESSYRVISSFGDGAYGAIDSGFEFNISFTNSTWG